MTAFTRAGLAASGFVGFDTIAHLTAESCRDVPWVPGVYAVLRVAATPVRFLSASGGGRFKGRDPTVSPATLRPRWITDTPVIYIGKADSLRRRLIQFMHFGKGRPVAHWGGRLIWQVQGSDQLMVAWREVSTPLQTEAELLKHFVAAYGTLPYANLRL